MNVYVNSVAKSQVNAMDALGDELQNDLICSDLVMAGGRSFQ
jgi:hypothetical protein